ncbi:hypothetical protein BH10ACI2_BH10ACI2_12960 [soil metagenome]
MEDLLTNILACPVCAGDLVEDGDTLTCAADGIVARKKLGIFDFLINEEILPVAADGQFGLAGDEIGAKEVFDRFETHGFRELQRFLAEKDLADAPKTKIEARAVERFHKRYAKMDSEIGLDAGKSIFNRVNPYLQSKDLPVLGGNIALEAGGGHGRHLPSFAKHFEKVVFVDCSLLNLLMGKKLASEVGLADKVAFVRADATALPFKPKTFDFVHESGVIEHVFEPQKLISEALRVLSDTGNYVCLSPNKYPLSPEPHFHLPLFGAFPKSLRKYIIRGTRGIDNEEGTDLLSLWRLKREFRIAGERNADPYFLPRQLPETTRKSFVRGLVHSSFQLPGVGAVANFLLNRLFLPIMPYHIVVISGSERAKAR